MKMELGGGGGCKADEGIGERNFLLPAARDILRFEDRRPYLTLLVYHSHPLTSSSLPIRGTKLRPPSRMLRLTFYMTAGLVALKIIMPALSATPPPRWKDLRERERERERERDPYKADKVAANISALYNLT